MGKVVKGAVLGGAVGATVVVVQSFQSEEPDEDLPRKAAIAAGAGALSGGFLGLLLARRSRKRQAKKAMKRAAALAASTSALEATARTRSRSGWRNFCTSTKPGRPDISWSAMRAIIPSRLRFWRTARSREDPMG